MKSPKERTHLNKEGNNIRCDIYIYASDYPTVRHLGALSTEEYIISRDESTRARSEIQNLSIYYFPIIDLVLTDSTTKRYSERYDPYESGCRRRLNRIELENPMAKAGM